MPSYLVTGASKGLGIEFVRQLTSKSDNLVIVTTRKPSKDLEHFKSSSKNLHIINLDVTDSSNISSLSSEVSKILGSSDTKLDYLLNSAGINATEQKILSLDPQDLQEHIRVNVIGPSNVVKALESHLQAGSVLMNMTSGVSSMHRMKVDKFGVGSPYAISKAALNMLSVMQSNVLEAKGVITVVMDPGHVKTDMGGSHAPLEPEESIGGMLKVLGGLKKEDNAKFFCYDGQEVPW